MTKVSRYHKCGVSLTILLVSASFAWSQSRSDAEFQLWTDFVMWVPTAKNIRIGGDAGARGFLTNSDWNQLYVRPAMQYRFNKSMVGAAGASYWRTANQEADNVSELRFHQDMEVINWPYIGFAQLYLRLRLEERFFFFETLENDWYMRARLMTGLATNDFTIGSQTFFIMALWEGFRPILNNSSPEAFIDRERYNLIIAHRFAPHWRYEVHTLLQNSRTYSDEGLSRDALIVRVRFFHNLPSSL